MSASTRPPSLILNPIEQGNKILKVYSPTLTDTSSSSHPHGRLDSEPVNVDEDIQRSKTNTPKLADETVSNPLFPPLPPHHTFLMTQIYRILSTVLSIGFLIFVVICAMLKTVPSMVLKIGSWCCFKDPHRLRPFYHE